MSSTPNYVLVGSHEYNQGSYDKKIMEAGTFIRPIELQYVPKHVLDSVKWKGFNKDKEVFCYTRDGIMPIPLALIRRV